MVKRIRAEAKADQNPEQNPEANAEANAPKSESARRGFQKGMQKPPGSGRKKGQTNRHSAALKDCIMNAMSMVGSNNRGKDGAEGYLAWMAWRHPEIFGRLLEKVLPFSLSGAGGGPVQVEYTNREDITLRLKERGLPLPTNLLAAPERKVVDADFEEVNDEDDE